MSWGHALSRFSFLKISDLSQAGRKRGSYLVPKKPGWAEDLVRFLHTMLIPGGPLDGGFLCDLGGLPGSDNKGSTLPARERGWVQSGFLKEGHPRGQVPGRCY